jgi:hypothetical protein
MNAKITGTFVDFSIRTHQDEHLLNWDENQWAKEFEEMKAAGIDTVIPARAMRWGQPTDPVKALAPPRGDPRMLMPKDVPGGRDEARA